MADPVKVKIDGEDREVRVPYKLKQLKRCWPHVKAATQSDDGMEAITAVTMILAIGLCPVKAEQADIAQRAEEIEETLDADEIPQMQKAVMEIMIRSGIIAEKANAPGEATGAAASPSTETSTASSVNSSPPVAKEAAGAE